MGAIRLPSPVKLICGMIAADPQRFAEAEAALTERFGAVDMRSDVLPFDLTTYYYKEMGAPLFRQFIAFEQFIDPSTLPDVKRWTNTLEERFAAVRDGQTCRRINLDPGYVNAAKLILATTKDHAHRVYLRDGIFAEVTLTFRSQSFQPMDWTYPDYRTAAYITFFNAVRARYLRAERQNAKV
ncbi:MAG: DUF4416 family protein [Abditibacteriales bacterium]|nr:DUF4416 family protein [Abditibacteriales bacterium]MDW8367370.1 DUF4416 family protein [Abditibacteriales bacterium]